MIPETGLSAEPAGSPLPLLTSPAVRPSTGFRRREEFMRFAPPPIGEEEIAEVVDTLRSGWITTGPKTQRFEQEFAQALGAPGALGVNSCTAALHTALVSLGIGPGDEVITSTLTFSASANVAEHVGARPVLVDVEPDTLNLSPEAVAAALTPRTRAIIAVHYAGHPADLDPLRALAAPRGIHVIEDAAHALPARYRGRPIGGEGHPTAFSFYATKNLTTGEGGMLAASPELLERARVLSLHGMSRDAWKRYGKGGSWAYDVVYPGFKYNMTDIQAALGLAQLRKLPGFHLRRRQIAAAYTAAFSARAELEPPVERADVEHAWHLYVLRLRRGALRITREQFIDELTARNVGTSVHFIPVHRHSHYRNRYGYVAESFPVADANFNRMLSLPIHPGMQDADVAYVIEAVLDVVECFRR